ncbi:MAG: aldehyde dehydrogenase family protein [Zoogloeaceae bacterium]|jgi:acyl-CoA reductase-like NAD-dependent aldehyde dehydrogenase|nr:aldehyde dehydrogenase family protein [Zoogloeaceae bacterium]
MQELRIEDAVPVLPSWINGRAFLSLTSDFAEVRNSQGEVLRRTPLCGADEVAAAVASAEAALPAWSALPERERGNFLVAWATALEGYAAHFARLICEESGMAEGAAQTEVAAAATGLKSATSAKIEAEDKAVKIAACVWNTQLSLGAVARLIAPALCAGGVVIIKPYTQFPGAVFALCELSARVGIPAGVVNLVQGEDAVLEALAGYDAVQILSR